MVPLILVAGTAIGSTNLKEITKMWWHPRSMFADQVRSAGIKFLNDGDPAMWNQNVDGIFGRNEDWILGAADILWWKIKNDDATPVDIIAHSHGGQVAIYLLAMRLRIRRLITVATPVRADMMAIMQSALVNSSTFESWHHIYSPDDGIWQKFGSFFSGNKQFKRTMPVPAVNIECSGLDHTELMGPEIWSGEKWLDLLLD